MTNRYQALLERPWDEAALQVWADGALERGEIAGELAQLALARERGASRFEGRLREAELLLRHGRELAAPALARLPDLSLERGRLKTLRFRSGVPAAVDGLETHSWSSSGLSGLLPIRELELRGLDERALPDVPGLERLDTLTVWHQPQDRAGTSSPWRPLLDRALPALARLRGNFIPVEALELLPSLSQLELSAIGGASGLGAPALRRLLDTRLAPTLTHLLLEGQGLDDSAALTLASAQGLKLQGLGLPGNPMGAPAARALGGAAFRGSLRALNLGRTNVPARALMGVCSWFPQLEELDLSSPVSESAQEPGFPAFIQGLDRARMKTLVLKGRLLDDALARALVEHGPWQRLSLLDFGAAQVEPKALRRFTTTDAFPALRTLRLKGAQLDVDAVAALTGSGLLQAVETLELPHCHFGTGVAERLAQAHAPRLLHLTVGAGTLPLSALRALYNFPRAPHLLTLDFDARPRGDLAGECFLDAASGVRNLETAGNVRPLLLELAASPRSSGLRVLRLTHARAFDDEVAQAFASSPYFEELGALELGPLAQLSSRAEQALTERFGPRVSLPRRD
jgi:hypothetical protein